MSTSEGHRERLRNRFRENPGSLSDVERLELLLTYVIPRKDVTPLARDLIARFGSLKGLIDAPDAQLKEIEGVGESTSTFIHLIQSILIEPSEQETKPPPTKQNTQSPQLNLFRLDPETKGQTYSV